MIAMQLKGQDKSAHWKMKNTWCEIVAEDRIEGRIWEYVAVLYGLKSYLKSNTVKAIYGSFEVVGQHVEYRCWIGSDQEIKKWDIYQDVADGEMWDDIRYLIDGHAEPII